MDTPPTLTVIERFAEIMDGLCALLLAQLEPRTWFGRLFGAPSRPVVLWFYEEMRGLRELFRVIAAGKAGDPPVITASGRDDTAPRGDAERRRTGTVGGGRRATRAVPNATPTPVSPCALARPAVTTALGMAFAPLRDCGAAAGPTGLAGFPRCVAGRVFSSFGACRHPHVQFVTID